MDRLVLAAIGRDRNTVADYDLGAALRLRWQVPAVLEKARERTPGGRLVTTADVVDAIIFLLENRSITGIGLDIDAGTMLI